MMLIQNGQFDEDSVRRNIRLLKSLVEDMEAFLEGNSPSAESLEIAPIIDGWEPARRDLSCLYGTILNHPLLGQVVPAGLTSQLWLLNLDQGWARTLSRYYRLGKQTDT